jgi:ribosomal protein S18 acetylase RimI-like enzyme
MTALENAAVSSTSFSLRRVSAEDAQFLFQLYASTRQEEIASFGWPADQAAVFLRMQFDVRRRSYMAAYPSAEESVIFSGKISAGSVNVYRCGSEIRLVDIALLPEYRRRGIGGEIIRQLAAESEEKGIPLRLSVFRSNPAARLYARLGFVATGGDAMYCEMERTASSRTQIR